MTEIKKVYKPLHAIYSRSCISHFLTSIERNRLKVRSVFPYVSVRELRDESAFLQDGRLVFTNINTQEHLLAVSDLHSK